MNLARHANAGKTGYPYGKSLEGTTESQRISRPFQGLLLLGYSLPGTGVPG